MPVYMKLELVSGSKPSSHEDWMELLSFNWKGSAEVRCQREVDGLSARLMRWSTMGYDTAAAGVTIDLVDKEDTVRWKLEEVNLVQYTVQNSDPNNAFESFVLRPKTVQQGFATTTKPTQTPARFWPRRVS